VTHLLPGKLLVIGGVDVKNLVRRASDNFPESRDDVYVLQFEVKQVPHHLDSTKHPPCEDIWVGQELNICFFTLLIKL
jgi:hypothetical protein